MGRRGVLPLLPATVVPAKTAFAGWNANGRLRRKGSVITDDLVFLVINGIISKQFVNKKTNFPFHLAEERGLRRRPVWSKEKS